MKIGVLGMGHFAGVVSGCLALRGHEVYQYDQQPWIVRSGQSATIDEPGIERLSKPWTCTTNAAPLHTCEVIWACYDVPLDTAGRADSRVVADRVERLCARFTPGTLVLVSSQWAVGTTRVCETHAPHVRFVYVMENVRVGHAIDDFLTAPAMIVGVSAPGQDRDPVLGLLSPFTERLEWTDFESAEMAKHALNAWLGLQIAFINEIARVSHAVGAESDDVARALFADARISPLAPLHPGPPFGGGSLQRDILQLMDLGEMYSLKMPIVQAILASNTP